MADKYITSNDLTSDIILKEIEVILEPFKIPLSKESIEILFEFYAEPNQVFNKNLAPTYQTELLYLGMMIWVGFKIKNSISSSILLLAEKKKVIINEKNTENLILNLVRSSGNQVRTGDVIESSLIGPLFSEGINFLLFTKSEVGTHPFVQLYEGTLRKSKAFFSLFTHAFTNFKARSIDQLVLFVFLYEKKMFDFTSSSSLIFRIVEILSKKNIISIDEIGFMAFMTGECPKRSKEKVLDLLGEFLLEKLGKITKTKNRSAKELQEMILGVVFDSAETSEIFILELH